MLNIEIDTAAVDVNVHPQKSEIKFSDESLVYKAMFKALTDALSRPMSAQKTEITLLPDSELNAYVKPKQNIVQPSLVKPAAQPLQPLRGSVSNKNTRPPLHNPIFKAPMERMEPIFKEPEGIYDRGRQETVIPVLEAREEFAKPTPSASTAAKALEPTPQSVEPKPQPVELKPRPAEPVATVIEPASAPQPAAQQQSPIKRETIKFTDTDSGIATIWPIGQVDKTFIIAQSEDTLYLIDQHAAHERILYDKLVAAHEQVPAQQLLIPMYIDLAADEIERITAYGEEFLKLGVDVEAGGETMLRINSLPTDIKPEDAEDFIQEICKMLGELRQVKPSDLRQEVLHMTACKAAIKAGQLLTMTQMRQLIIDLCNTEHPFTCPHGRPCMIAIDSDQLYKMFKRTGF